MFFAPAGPDQRIIAVPAAGSNVSLWILGLSNFGAMLTAELGLPYAFASHFAPDLLLPALYRSRFKPSEQFDRPMRWQVSTSSPPMPQRKRNDWRPRNRCPLAIFSAGDGGG